MVLQEYADIYNPKNLPRKKRYLRFYLLGIADAEGCFSVSIKKQTTARFGWVLDPVFTVSQHINNETILELFKRELMCGRIDKKHGQPNTLVFTVDNRRQLAEKLIPFFEKYKPITKQEDFKKFLKIVFALERKDHSDLKKFKRLIKEAFSMNLEGKQRRYRLEEVLESLDVQDSSETIRQTPNSR